MERKQSVRELRRVRDGFRRKIAKEHRRRCAVAKLLIEVQDAANVLEAMHMANDPVSPREARSFLGLEDAE